MIASAIPIFAGLLTIGCALLSHQIAPRLKLLDMPGGRKHHHTPTPLMGGVVIVAALLPALAMFSAIQGGEAANVTTVVILATLFVTALGLMDDRRGIRPMWRLLICTAIMLITSIGESRLEITNLIFGSTLGSVALGPFSIAATVLCLVALINAVNMADGKNGLVIGLCLCWTLLLLASAPPSLQTPLLTLAVVLAVLLPFNLAGKLFLGDGGSYGLSALIGLLAIYVYRRAPGDPSADLFALIFLIPTIDMLRLVFVRIRRGQSPFTGDRDHLHHHLLHVFGWPRGLLIYLGVSIVPAAVAFRVQVLSLPILIGAVIGYSVLIYYLHRYVMLRPMPERRAVRRLEVEDLPAE